MSQWWHSQTSRQHHSPVVHIKSHTLSQTRQITWRQGVFHLLKIAKASRPSRWANNCDDIGSRSRACHVSLAYGRPQEASLDSWHTLLTAPSSDLVTDACIRQRCRSQHLEAAELKHHAITPWRFAALVQLANEAPHQVRLSLVGRSMRRATYPGDMQHQLHFPPVKEGGDRLIANFEQLDILISDSRATQYLADFRAAQYIDCRFLSDSISCRFLSSLIF